MRQFEFGPMNRNIALIDVKITHRVPGWVPTGQGDVFTYRVNKYSSIEYMIPLLHG